MNGRIAQSRLSERLHQYVSKCFNKRHDAHSQTFLRFYELEFPLNPSINMTNVYYEKTYAHCGHRDW